MRANEVSLFIGLILTIFLCLIVFAITPDDPMYCWPGVLAIIIIVFFAGLKNIPTQHAGVLKIFGKRWHINFYEGWCCIPLFTSVELVDCKLDVVDVPLIKILTKNNIEVGVDIWVWLEVDNPFIYFNLKNPQEMIKTGTISKSNEAASEFVRKNTDKQCLDGSKQLQDDMRRKMSTEEEKLGVRVSDIDIRPILPTAAIMQEYAEDKKKEIKTKRFAKTLKRIKKEAEKLTDSEAANTALVVQGDVKKEIKEEKKTFKLDVEPKILEFVAEFLPKKKKTEETEGDKK